MINMSLKWRKLLKEWGICCTQGIFTSNLSKHNVCKHYVCKHYVCKHYVCKNFVSKHYVCITYVCITNVLRRCETSKIVWTEAEISKSKKCFPKNQTWNIIHEHSTRISFETLSFSEQCRSNKQTNQLYPNIM